MFKCLFQSAPISGKSPSSGKKTLPPKFFTTRSVVLNNDTTSTYLPVCPRVFVKSPQLFIVVTRFHPLFNLWPVTLDPLINLFSCQDVSPIQGKDGPLGYQLLGKQAVIPR